MSSSAEAAREASRAMVPSTVSRLLSRWGRAGWLLAAAALMLAPLGALALDLARVPVAEWGGLALPSGGQLLLLGRSVALSLGTALGATLIGTAVAMLLWSARSQARLALSWMLLAFVAVPPYIHALAWSSTWPLAGWPAVLWVHWAWFSPLAVALTLAGLDALEPESFDAARLCTSPWRAFVAVVLPSTSPYVLAAFALSFAVSLIDFTVPSLLHVDVYALDLFAELGASGAPGRVVWMSTPLVLIAAASALLLRRALRATGRPRIDRTRRRAPVSWPWWLRILQGAAATVLLAGLTVPVVALASMAGSAPSGWAALELGRRELGTTALVATLAAIGSLLVARPWAWELRRVGTRGTLAWSLLAIPLVLPPSIVGVGLIGAFNHSATEWLYQSRLIVAVACVVRFAPCAALTLWAAQRQRDPALLDAMRVHQRSSWHGWLRVGFGIELAGWLAGGALVFALSVGELGASLLVAPPGHATLTMRLYNYLHSGAAQSVASTCLTMWALAVGAGAVAFGTLRWLARGWRNDEP